MSSIPNIIGPRVFQLLSARIGEILIDEITNQHNLTGDDDLNGINFFIERVVPIDPTELPAINVRYLNTKTDNQSKGNGMFTSEIIIDVYSVAKSNSNERGDFLSKIKTQKVLGLIMAILMNQSYKQLGYNPGTVGNVMVNSIELPNQQPIQDEKNATMGRLSLTVYHAEGTDLKSATLINGMDTFVKIDITNLGFKYTSNYY